jgi:heme oxygenase (mycobilin-producing)
MEHTPGLETSPPGRDTFDVERGVRASRGGRWRLASRRMYVSLSRLRIDPDRAPELVAAFRDRIGLVDAFDGFVDLQVWQSDRDSGEIVMVSRWDTRAHFTAYMRSREHRVSHGRIDPALDGAIELERLEHLHTYEVVAE